MKKFTKGCLISALILFVFGCAFCGICGAMGGFRQLDSLNEDGIYSFGLGRWGYLGGWLGFLDDDDWDIDIPDIPGAQKLAGSETAQTNYRASDITAIDIELGRSNLTIRESEDDYIRIQNGSSTKTVKYGMSNGVFKLYNGRTFGFWSFGNVSKGSVYLYLPKGMDLNSIDIEMGAGNVESISLEADEINLEAGAGNFIMEELLGRDISISVGAGKADIGNIDAGALSIEAGAGDIQIQKINVNSLDMEVAAGSLDAAGSVNGDVDIECAAGSVDMELQGAETDYDYEIDCAAGSVRVGSNEYSGIANERSIDNGSRKEMNIECAAGNVEIRFVQ